MNDTTAKSRSSRAAHLLTTVFAPAHLVMVLLLVVGAVSDSSSLHGLGWGVLTAVLIGGVPYAWVLYAVRRGRFTSRHIPDRAQRILPLSVAAVAAGAGLLLIGLLGAPQALVALVVAMVTGLAVTLVVTRYWKISVHTAVAAGTVTILTIVLGSGLSATCVVVVATGWSRVQVRDHTLAQVVAGAALGVTIAATVFLLLR